MGAARGQGRTFKLGLIGCGGRGRGADAGALEPGKILGFDVKVVATAEDFERGTVEIPEENIVPRPGSA